MQADAAASDRALGLGALLTVLALAGAAGMLVAGSQPGTAWAFAVAVAAGVAAIVAMHLYAN